MSMRSIFCALVTWAVSATLANAQVNATPEKLVRVTYPIADLIVPIQDHTAFPERHGGPAAAPRTKNAQPDRPIRTIGPDKNAELLARMLVDLIKTTVARETWEDQGGAGSIQFFPLGNAIVVNQTRNVQDDVVDLLAALRRMYEVQVSIETRFVVVSPKLAERFTKDMEGRGNSARVLKGPSAAQVKKASRAWIVDDVATFMFLESVQGDQSASILQTPKIAMYNNQRVGINTTTWTAVRCDYHPVVDAERRNVRLRVDFESDTAGAESEGIRRRDIVNAASTFVVPDGKTLIWSLGALASRNHQFLMVTPRVLIVREEEAPIPGR